eukprot:gene33708-biopygen26690
MGSKALGLVSTLQYPVLPNFTQEIKKILYQISLEPPKLDLLPIREIEPPATDVTATAVTAVQAPIMLTPVSIQPTSHPLAFTAYPYYYCYAEMWAWISDRSKAVDAEKLSAFLSELGLSRADELGYCDGAMWEDLASPFRREGSCTSWRRTISPSESSLACLLMDR